MSEKEENAAYDRIDQIQKQVHEYYKSQFNQYVLSDCWSLRRDLVASSRKKRMETREELKEDLVWLVGQIEEMTRRGAGPSSMYMLRAKVAVTQIVEIL